MSGIDAPKAPSVTTPKDSGAEKLQKEKIQRVKARYEDESFLATEPAQTEKEKTAKREAEIKKMDQLLPIENFERFNMRADMIDLAQRGIIKEEDIPDWVDADATGELLYGYDVQPPWRAKSLKQSIEVWKAFLKDHRG